MENVALKWTAKQTPYLQLNEPLKPCGCIKASKVKCQRDEAGVDFHMQQYLNQKTESSLMIKREMENSAFQTPLGKSKQIQHSIYNLTTQVPPQPLL